MKKSAFSRRNFLTGGAGVAASIAAATITPAEAREIKGGEPWMPHQADQPDPIVSPTYVYFTKAEADFVEAATERLIPHDELGPGAKDCNVALSSTTSLPALTGRRAVGTCRVHGRRERKLKGSSPGWGRPTFTERQ